MFDAYGTRASTDNSADPYSGYGAQYGYYSDPETGLQLLGQRYYNPSAGRFVTRDPIGYAGGTNLYSYCRNNPVSGADPSGNSDFFESMFLGYMRFSLKMVNVTGDARYNKAVDYMFPPDPCDGFNYEFPFMIASMMTPGGWESAAAGHAVQAAEEAKEVNVVVKLCENGGCFIAGTPVQMADGTTKPIEHVHEGDLVASRDEKTGKTEAKPVIATVVHEQVPTITLRFENGETIVTTGPHPFYVTEKGFVQASDLAIGNAIVTRAGPPNSITQIEHTGPSMVYNLTVESDHTYFVGNRDGGVWVHNSDICNKYIRAKFRQSTRDKVWEQAEADALANTEDGIVRDPNTKEALTKDGDWDMGHKQGWEFKKHVESARRRNLTRKEFLNEYNNASHYRPESPAANQSRQFDAPNDINNWP